MTFTLLIHAGGLVGALSFSVSFFFFGKDYADRSAHKGERQDIAHGLSHPCVLSGLCIVSFEKIKLVSKPLLGNITSISFGSCN